MIASQEPGDRSPGSFLLRGLDGHRFAVFLCVVFCRFFVMMFGLEMVSVRDMRMVSRFFRLACFVKFCRFFVMVRGVLVMFCRVAMMLGCRFRISHNTLPL